jgi:DNA-binding NarL/FixJ family response regulator
MSAPVRIGLVADEDAYFRVALSAILNRYFGFTEIVEAASFDEALQCLGENADISAAIFTLSMPGTTAPTNLRAVRECFPNARVAIISGSSSRRDILLALEAGVHGYMLKSLSITDLVAALRTIFDGGIYVPASLADVPPASSISAIEEQARTTPSEQSAAEGPLTPRQRDVLDLLTQGKTNKEIAIALGLGEGTVKIHMAAIFRFFGVNNRAAAAVAGARPYPNRNQVSVGGRASRVAAV